MTNDEEVLKGGAINTVTRRGDVVYRSGGSWSVTVLALLGDLQRVGFTQAPAPLGMDEQGREMIAFMPGEPMMRPWRAVMFTDDAVRQAAAMLRALHDATRDLAYPTHTEWRTGAAGKAPGQVIRHGDLGPWNTLWQGDAITGLIDWDFAEPGEAITDLAQMALYFVPLRGEAHWRECGFPERPDFRRRVTVLHQAYGAFSVADVVHEVDRLQRASMAEIAERAAEGRYPWTMFRDNGEVAKTQAELDWLHGEFPDILVPGA
jgi:hypothetical protein